jgi:DNA-binding transcriptional LysR family regulator
MDTEYARTFLAVAAAGNFVGAARRLHVTQSTVSARIQTLENQLGVVLFRRGRGGAELTPAGQRFLRHAKALVRTLETAIHEVGLPAGYRGSLTLRARIALWDGFLPKWSEWMRQQVPDVSLRTEIGFEEDIMQGLVQGTTDIGLMYTPENRPGLGIEYLFDESLLLVSTDPDAHWPNDRYIHVDWGAEFEAQFSTHYPEVEAPALLANVGWLAIQQILHAGGSAFVPQRLARPFIESGRLFRLPGSRIISLPAYLVFPQDKQDSISRKALEGLRLLGAQER